MLMQSPSHATKVAPAKDLQYALTLIAAIWITGAVGHFTPMGEWGALFLYVIGSIALTLWYGAHFNAFEQIYITRKNLKQALIWAGAIGGVLFVVDVVNTYFYFKNGGTPMVEMERILVGMNLLYVFPILILAEEFLWRGLLFSALMNRGVNKHLVVALTTLAFMLNHYAVAPVDFVERGLMAMMALPIGIANGYLVIKAKNLWSGVMLHGLTMLSMMCDLFIVPKLI